MNHRELSIAPLVRFLLAIPIHSSSRPRLFTSAHIFLNLFQDLIIAILSVVGGMPVDYETPVVTFSILKICSLILSEVLIGIGLHACIHRDECTCVYVSICVCTMF